MKKGKAFRNARVPLIPFSCPDLTSLRISLVFSCCPIHLSLNFESYFLVNLIGICCILNCKEIISKHWKKISRFRHLEYIPEKEEDLFEFRAKSGKIINWQLPLTGYWSKIKSKLFEQDIDNYKFINSNKEIILIQLYAGQLRQLESITLLHIARLRYVVKVLKYWKSEPGWGAISFHHT